jgi:chaperonin GroES
MIKPLMDRLWVERLPTEETTEGGIFIPEMFEEKPDIGVVKAVGPGIRDEDGEFIEININVGDKVLFGRTAGTTVEVDKEEYFLIRHHEILGVVKT